MLIQAIHDAKLTEERTRGHLTWPSTRYEHDPVGFCRDILGDMPTGRQIEILETVARSDRTAIKAARKVGKSRTLGREALWFFCLYEDSTVVLVAPSERQIVEIAWREVVSLFHGSGRCLSCKLTNPNGPKPCPHSTPIDGELSASVRSGLRAGMRRIIGVAPRNADRARGISGPHQLWLIDESPGVSKEIYSAADGNRAGGAKLVCAGNPTSRNSWFADCFERLAFERVTITALESPNVVFGQKLIPGMADTGWIEEVKAEHGEDSPKYQCDVMGQFPSRDMLRLISEAELAAAYERFDALDGQGGELAFGIDPAGGGAGGDDSVIVVRRGARVLALNGFVGGTDRIMAELDALLVQHRKWPGEAVQVNFDAAGGWGADLAHALRERKKKDDALSCDGLESRGDARQIVALRDSGCARPRDAFYLNMAQRLKTEVGLPFDPDLHEELLFAEWQVDRTEGSRLIEKKEYRRRLGRSPDKSDALSYALWTGRVLPLSSAAVRVPEPEPRDEPVDPRRRRLEADPFEGRAENWIDPYGSFSYGPAGKGRGRGGGGEGGGGRFGGDDD